LGIGADVDITEIQCEHKPYSTLYTPSSRSGLIRDYSGFFNDSVALTESNTPRWISEAKVGVGAYLFNGEDDFIITNPIIISTDMSWSIWVKSESPKNIFLIDQRNSEVGVQPIYIASTGLIQFFDSTNGSLNTDTNIFKFDGISHHIVSVGTKVDRKIYYDGVLISTILTGITVQTSRPIFLGTRFTQASFFNGILDDVRVYATALSDKDIKDLYEDRAEIEQSGVLYARDFLSNVEETENIIFYENAVSQTSYVSYVITSEGTWAQNHPNAIRAYNKAGNEITGYVNTGVTDWTNTIHAIWEYDSILNKPVVVMNDSDSSSPWMAKSFPITRTSKTLSQLGLKYGDKYTLSWLQWADNISGGPYVGLYGQNLLAQNGFHDGTQFAYNTVAKKWQRVSVTFAVNANRDLDNALNLSFYMYGHASNTIIKIADVQLDLKDHATPFTDSYRPAIQLPSTIKFGANEIHETGTENYEDFSTVGITDGLIGYWPLNGDARDLSGLNSTENAITNILWVAGKVNIGADFNGTSKILINNNSVFNFIGAQPYTVMAMIYPRLGGVTWHGVFSKGNSQQWALTLNSPNGYLHYETNQGGIGALNTATGTILANTWYHVVIRFDGTNKQIFINGSSVATQAASTLNSTSNIEELRIGEGNNSELFNGIIDEVKVFNRALTDEEIKIEYDVMFNNEVLFHESGTVYAKALIQY